MPEARLGTLPKTYTSSKQATRLHSSRLQKGGFSQAPQQESQRREFVVDSGASMHMVTETLTRLSWHHEDIKESDDADDGQRRGANK